MFLLQINCQPAVIFVNEQSNKKEYMWGYHLQACQFMIWFSLNQISFLFLFSNLFLKTIKYYIFTVIWNMLLPLTRQLVDNVWEKNSLFLILNKKAQQTLESDFHWRMFPPSKLLVAIEKRYNWLVTDRVYIDVVEQVKIYIYFCIPMFFLPDSAFCRHEGGQHFSFFTLSTLLLS